MKCLFESLKSRDAKVAIIGLGYVGLPLAIEIANAGFDTMGIDSSADKVRKINGGGSYIKDISAEVIASVVNKKKLRATGDYSVLKDCDFVVIAVPTPLSKGKDPDISFIVNSAEEVKKYLRAGHAISLESTTYPGTTEEVVLPLLEETGLKVGKDFYLAFSPERIDPGNEKYGLKNTPKVVGGVTHGCTEVIQSFYQAFVDKVVPVSSPRVAEMAKILENTFRAINIGLANEVAIMCQHFGIDTWEVIEAAASKPFGFMPFYPGPGLGGHCIPVDPHYLLWKMRMMDYNARFIQLADEINSSMPGFVVEKISNALNDRRKPVKGTKILALGVAYKKDIDDYRESPALNVINLLREKGADISYYDPYVPHIKIEGSNMSSVGSMDGLQTYDCVVILTNHSCFDYEKIAGQGQLIVDTRNAMKKVKVSKDKLVKI